MIQKFLWYSSLTLNGSISFSWNPGWKFLIWRDWILLLQLLLGIRLWIKQLSVFCHHRTSIKKRRIYIYISVQGEKIWGHVLWGGGVFHYECYFDYPHFTFHTVYRKNNFVQFYHENTFDFHYKVQVYNVISVVVHNNHWWNWMLPQNPNSVLSLFSLERYYWCSINVHKK